MRLNTGKFSLWSVWSTSVYWSQIRAACPVELNIAVSSVGVQTHSEVSGMSDESEKSITFFSSWQRLLSVQSRHIFYPHSFLNLCSEFRMIISKYMKLIGISNMINIVIDIIRNIDFYWNSNCVLQTSPSSPFALVTDLQALGILAVICGGFPDVS